MISLLFLDAFRLKDKRNLLAPMNRKSAWSEKLVFRYIVRFLFVLTNGILLKTGQWLCKILQMKKLIVYQKCIKYAKIGKVYFIFNIKYRYCEKLPRRQFGNVEIKITIQQIPEKSWNCTSRRLTIMQHYISFPIYFSYNKMDNDSFLS